MPTIAASLLTTMTQQLDHYFSAKDHFVLAISGGADSMALLHICNRAMPKRFVVVTVDHGLRPDSGQDTQLVAMYCEQWGIECIIEHLDLLTVAQNQNLEAVARERRYQILERYRQQRKAAAIITAHHHQDQLETQLMHLNRGCSIPGLIGMATINDQRIFRPLLAVEKTALLAYAASENIPWREDSTNKDTTYQRNRFRHFLIPQVPATALDALSKQAIQFESTIKTLVDDWFQQYCQGDHKQQFFIIQNWLKQPLFIQLQIIYQLLTKQLGKENVGATTIGHVHQWCLKARKGSSFSHLGKVLFIHEKSLIKIAQPIEK